MVQVKYERAGDIVSKTYMRDAKPHGISWKWSIITGVQLGETPYQKGLKHGIAREWHFNGALRSEAYFFRGIPSGLERHYHGNGVLMREVLWINGNKCGTERVWNLIGDIYSEVQHGGFIQESKEKTRIDTPVFGNAEPCIYRVHDHPLRPDQKETVYDAVDIVRPSSYEMAVGALMANKVKRWRSDGVGPDEMRERLLETKTENIRKRLEYPS